MDSSANYLAQAKDVKDGAKTTVESPDEEIVVFANGTGNGLKSANKVPIADGKAAPGGSDAADAVDGDGAASAPTGPADNDNANGLADAFNKLSVNTKPDAKFDYTGLNDYRPPAKYPSISVSPHGDVNGSAGVEWQHQQAPKGGRKAGDEQSYGGAPQMYGRPLNAAASDFQVRGAPTPAAYPGYGAPGAYGSYQGVPPMHGNYVNHGYDVFGLSPTLTEPSVAGGIPGARNPASTNGTNGSTNRYAPPPQRNSANGGDPTGMGLNLNGLGGGAAGAAPYSPIPLSPSPLSLNPYAAHHHAQMQQLNHAHMNGHPMGAYMPPPPTGPGKTDASGAPTSNGANAANGNGAAPGTNGTAPGYPPQTQGFYGVSPSQQYYDESAAMYANAYGAPHLQHGMQHPHNVHPQYQMNPQMGPPHPGTPQIGGYAGYMTGPMMGVPGVPAPGMVPVPSPGGQAGQNGAGTGQGNGGAQNGMQQGGSNGVVNGSAQAVTSVVNGLTLINGVPQPNADGTGPSANNRKLGLYKTELCRSWEEKGSCRYGPKCQFAHGEEEIRKVARHPKYKTEICRTFWLSGSCPYGKRCCFIHTDAPANGNGGEANKPGAGTGPSTAAAGTATTGGANAPGNSGVDGTVTPGHTRTTSSASEANNEQPPSSLLARISAKRAEGEKTPSPQGPPRIAPNGAPRPDFSHNRHLSSMSDGRPNDPEAAPAFNARPGHSHSASAHTLMTPTFTSTNGGLGYGSSAGTPTAVDGNGNLTPGSYWGHKRSASGGSATNGGWSGNESPAGTQPEQPLRSIYSSLTPTA